MRFSHSLKLRKFQQLLESKGWKMIDEFTYQNPDDEDVFAYFSVGKINYLNRETAKFLLNRPL